MPTASWPSVSAVPDLVPTEVETIAAYDALAPEYDHLAHATTRLLERASALGLRRSGLGRILAEATSPDVLELGAGTGSLTAHLLERQRSGRILLSDPAPRMLDAAVAKLAPLANGVTLEPLVASATEAVRRIDWRPAAIVAGLADPYLSTEVLEAVRGVAAPHTLLFITVPGWHWASVERAHRLGVPADQTRFRTSDGEVVRSRSAALTEEELVALLATGSFGAIRQGTVKVESARTHPPPEVTWVLAEPVGP